MATARTETYESRFLQTYGGVKQLILNINDCDATDTLDLAAITAYKKTKTIVDAATAKNYDEELNISNLTTADIRFVYGIATATGAFVPVVASSTATLTIGDVAATGLSTAEVELIIIFKEV